MESMVNETTTSVFNDGGEMPDAIRHQDELQNEVLQCLDSVHHLLKRRELLHQSLRQGWMQLTSARYAMGHSRISAPLFSLKPHAPSVVVEVKDSYPGRPEWGASAGNVKRNTPVEFILARNKVEEERATLPNNLKIGGDNLKTSSQLRRRLPLGAPRDGGMKEMLDDWTFSNEYRTDDEEDPTETQTPREMTQPLHWFGALVSPHLRSAQNSFSQALDLIMELVNAQEEAAVAHTNVREIQIAADQ